MKAIQALVISSGRPWWQVRYRDGRVRSEWDSIPGAVQLPLADLGPASRWEELDRRGLVGVRLLCPDGVAAELEAKEDGKVFQLKVGGVSIGPAPQARRWCEAQVIGALLDPEGNCVCRAWEMRERRLVDFKDNVFDMRYRGIGPLSLENLGITL